MPAIKDLISTIETQNPNYNSSPPHVKFELAKLFIRKKLCNRCRKKVIDRGKNDFRDLKLELCPLCYENIYDSLERAINIEKIPTYIFELNAEIRRRLLEEIEIKTGENAYDLLKRLHKIDGLTAPAVKELLFNKYQIYIHIRHLNRIMREMGILDTHSEALRKRVVSGRMDFTKRHIDYSTRKIDYKLRYKRKKAGLPPKDKFILIRADDNLREQIKSLSKKHKRTISQTVRILLDGISGTTLPQKYHTYADKLNYALEHKIKLLDTEEEKMHGIKVIMTKRDIMR